MPDDLLIALNPEEDSSLPYLVRIPLGAAGIVLKTRDTWPRTSKVYCHRATGWPLMLKSSFEFRYAAVRAGAPPSIWSSIAPARTARNS